jgi:hypothetical protein
MTDDTSKITFEPFITVSLACVREPYQRIAANKIAIASNAPGITGIHMYDAPAARRLVDDINKLIAVLDPPPVVTDKILGAVQRPKRKYAKRVQGKRK